MSAQHTPGRLIVRNGYSLYAADGKTPVADTCLTNSVPDNDEANARRLVACWNACEGLPDEFLNSNPIKQLVQSLWDRNSELEGQRDELLAALRGLVASCDTGERGPDGRQHGTRMPDRCFVQAGHDAIASVKGGAE